MSEMEISDREQLHPDNERLIFIDHFFENGIQRSTPLVRQLDEAPDLPQESINIEHSISHLGSWLCFFWSPGGLLKRQSDLWRVHLHGSGTRSTASMPPASQTLLNVWVTRWEGLCPLRWVSIIAKTLQEALMMPLLLQVNLRRD